MSGALVSEAYENDAAVRASLSVNLLAEIFIVRNQYPALGVCFTDDLVIFSPPSLLEHGEDFMPLPAQPLRHFRSGALVHEEAHPTRPRPSAA